MTMAAASLKQPSHLLYALVLATFLLFRPVYSDKEDHLIQRLNSFRTQQNRSALTLNKNAKCVAKKIAQELADHKDKYPCTEADSDSPSYKETGLSHYPKIISECVVDMHTTHDALVLPVCAPKLVLALVLANFTRTHYNSSITSSDFTGVGAGSKDDWMVVVLSTNTGHGSIANGVSSLFHAKLGISYYIVFLLLGFVLFCF